MAEEQPTQSTQATPPSIFGNDKPAEQTNPPPATPPVEPKADVPEAKPEDTPKPEAETPKPVVPEKYDLKLSENSILDQPVVKRIEDYARKQGLSQEDAQSILKAQEEDVAAFIEDRKAAWKAEALADKELGANLNENIAHASRALDAYGSPKLKADFERSGYGNHPEMIRAFAKIGRAMANDQAVHAKSVNTAPQVSLADFLYPTTAGK